MFFGLQRAKASWAKYANLPYLANLLVGSWTFWLIRWSVGKTQSRYTGGFTFKTYQMFSVYTMLKEYESHNHRSFWICVCGKLTRCAKSHASFSKCFRSHENGKPAFSNSLGHAGEARFRKAPFLRRISGVSCPNRRNKAAYKISPASVASEARSCAYLERL